MTQQHQPSIETLAAVTAMCRRMNVFFQLQTSTLPIAAANAKQAMAPAAIFHSDSTSKLANANASTLYSRLSAHHVQVLNKSGTKNLASASAQT